MSYFRLLIKAAFLLAYWLIGKALITGNGYSLIKINNAAYKPVKLGLWELRNNMITAQNSLDVE